MDGDYLKTCEPEPKWVVKLSKACREKLDELGKKGYEILRAEVRFVVWWKGKTDEEETAIVLPSIYFQRTRAFKDRQRDS